MSDSVLKKSVYLDYQSTTPVDPQVLQIMLPYFTERFGNASSRTHSLGWLAEAAVENAREQVAKVIGASKREVYFTSGATESNNLSILGVARANRERGNHIITTAVEHEAVLDPCRELEREGFRLTILPVDRFGRVDPVAVEKAMTNQTILVSVIFANNEIGTINPISQIGHICKKHNVFFHTDAVQAVGKIAIQVDELGVDLLSITAHKFYGPKGVGALYVRRRDPRVKIEPLLFGGGQERGLRSGTLNVPGIVGLGKAAELSLLYLDSEPERLRSLRDRLWLGLQKNIKDVTLNGHPTERLPNNLNISVAGIEGESLILVAKEIALSTGSACASQTLEPSHVLQAIGVQEDLLGSSLRLSVGRMTTEEDVDFAIERISHSVKELRDASPLYGLHQPSKPEIPRERHVDQVDVQGR